jgi:hypothetical protein
MRSRALRTTCGALAWIAVGLAAFFLFRSEQQIAQLAAGVRAFDLHARDVSTSLTDLRAAQQAYVAAGQGVAFWMPKVASETDAVRTGIASLRESADSSAASAELMEAEAAVAEFITIDKRARDYIKLGDQLMAGDVVFTEGAETAVTAARHVESARIAEQQAYDRTAATIRTQEALAIGGAAAICVIVVFLLIPVGKRETEVVEPQESSDLVAATPAPQAPPSSTIGTILRTTADLATDFGRIRDLPDLHRLLARAADVMDASGVVVWLGTTGGADLQPVAAHGYTAHAIARMPSVPRSANNAAAAAYRTGAMQIVLSRPGSATGALVAPILAPDGCIGALSAEIRHGGEGSETIQAMATIFAAHLAGVFAATASEPRANTKAAAQG